MNLSANFTLERLIFSPTAVRLGINNTPPGAVVENLKVTADYLERIQAALGQPVHLNDVYRCQALNHVVGGSRTSSHMDGYAADFTSPAFGTPVEVIKRVVEAGIPYDQIIYEGTWVHFGCDPRMRAELATAAWALGGARTYTAGIPGVTIPVS